ncbi:AGAP010276-PA-like protein [Anopheles sinensis]|uniref:Protein-serine/threonine kinase n=1 Tax=Anopheles sinensis TaxID=74873 RepID=A0A084W5M0_ANOSI|nr:AGAP010276-PA-like protein [Anopheles sinensis]
MRLFPVRLSNINKMLDFYSQFNPSPLSIKQFIDFGLNACPRKSYVFLRKELPVRLANIMKEITLLPESLLRMPSVGLVSAWYVKSFEEVLAFEKTDPSEGNLEKYLPAPLCNTSLKNHQTPFYSTFHLTLLTAA